MREAGASASACVRCVSWWGRYETCVSYVRKVRVEEARCADWSRWGRVCIGMCWIGEVVSWFGGLGGWRGARCAVREYWVVVDCELGSRVPCPVRLARYGFQR